MVLAYKGLVNASHNHFRLSLTERIAKNMSKFYEVSKVLDKRTDAHGRVQYLVRWRGYGKKNDSWVGEADTNERLKQVFRTRHQGTPGLLQTLALLVAEKLNMKKPPTTSIVRRSSVTMPMDAETFKELFGGLPSAPNLLQATKFSVPIHELDAIMPAGWSLNTFKTSTTCRLQGIRSFRLRVVSPTVCSPTNRVDSPTSYMSVRLRVRC